MEEQFGALWHRVITRMAARNFPEAAVRLDTVRTTVGILFRALGGDGGLSIEATDAHELKTRRTWLQRIAGSHARVALAWRDERALFLPPVIDCFDQVSLNRDLYLWLAALSTCSDTTGPWLQSNQRHCAQTLQRYPGLRARYQRLVAAHLAMRPQPEQLGSQAAALEQTVRQALLHPEQDVQGDTPSATVAAVPLWLHPDPPVARFAEVASDDDSPNGQRQPSQEAKDMQRKRAERVDSNKGDRGLIATRMENIFSWGEFVNVDRTQEDEDDMDKAEQIAQDLDQLAVARQRRNSASALKFDLDLPPEAADDLILEDGILQPEWDWKSQTLQPDRCRIVHMVADAVEPMPVPAHLARTVKRLRDQFQALAPARVWQRGQPDGQEVDLEAYLRQMADRAAGHGDLSQGLYRDMRNGGRDLSCLLLADLSLSTDTWINNHHRVIDVIRDAMVLFGEALSATGDRFAMCGFSSRKQNPVRVHKLKDFSEPYGADIRGRLARIKPGYYTRLGAGIRFAAKALSEQPSHRRLLLILTDGKPNDLDKYEGRYGIEDTRHAVQEARKLGLQPFCVTIDRKGSEYLPYLFGQHDFVIVRDPRELPARLPLLYARLTA